jgi:hypothetical protein
MADAFRLAENLERAIDIFSLAGQLGRDFLQEKREWNEIFDPEIWRRSSAPKFGEFYSKLREMDCLLRPLASLPRDVAAGGDWGGDWIYDPIFKDVADHLASAGYIAHDIKEITQQPEYSELASPDLIDFYPGYLLKAGPLGSRSLWGLKSVQQVAQANGLPEIAGRAAEVLARIASGASDNNRSGPSPTSIDEPLPALLEEANSGLSLTDKVGRLIGTEAGSNAEVFALLDRFPANAKGHIEFLEFIRDDIQKAVVSKRFQVQKGYSDETIRQTVDGIIRYWPEARRRLGALRIFLPDAAELVDRVLQRELTVGAIDRIDDLMTPAVGKLRDEYEDWRLGKAPELVEEEPPEVRSTRDWLEVDGLKGCWNQVLAVAEYWDLEVDDRHRTIAFLLQRVIGGDPSESEIREYLYHSHGLLPSDDIDHSHLEDLLRQDAERMRERQIDHNSGAATPHVVEKSGKGDTRQDVLARLLNTFTGGLSDARFDGAQVIIQDGKLSTNEKLTKVNCLLPIPPTVSAKLLGKLLGVSKQAVLKTSWWKQNRKGEKDEMIDKRQRILAKRSKQNESSRDNDD